MSVRLSTVQTRSMHRTERNDPPVEREPEENEAERPVNEIEVEVVDPQERVQEFVEEIGRHDQSLPGSASGSYHPVGSVVNSGSGNRSPAHSNRVSHHAQRTSHHTHSERRSRHTSRISSSHISHQSSHLS